MALTIVEVTYNTSRKLSSSFTVFDRNRVDQPTGRDITGFYKLETALEREVAYFARINRDASDGSIALSAYQHVKSLPPYLKEDLKAWIKQFKQWKPEDIFELKDPTEDQVKIFIQKHLEKPSQ